MRNKIIMKMAAIWAAILFFLTIGHWVIIKFVDFIQCNFGFSQDYMELVFAIISMLSFVSLGLAIAIIIDPKILDKI